MALVVVEGVGASTLVAVLMAACKPLYGRPEFYKIREWTHREGDVCETAESFANLRGPSPTNDGRLDVLENDESTFATGAMVMCTVWERNSSFLSCMN